MTELIPPVPIEDLPPFQAFLAANIPAVYDNTMSYYDELTGLIAYIQNTLIPAVNTNQEALVQLQGLYTQLKDYVDHYFDNLDVQEEINHKIDEMVIDGTFQQIFDLYVGPQLQTLDTKIDNTKIDIEQDISDAVASEARVRLAADNHLQTQINEVASGSPLVAASTSEMTDTSRVYVNTTDGKWYYYDGDSWEIGGTYQATGLADGSVGYYNLRGLLKESSDIKTFGGNKLFWKFGVHRVNGNLTSSATGCTSACFKVAEGTVITQLSEDTTARYTFYNLDGTYIGNTGSYAFLQPYTVTQDCYVSLTYVGSLDDCDDMFTVTGITTNKYDVNFHYYHPGQSDVTSRLESNIIYLHKGAKIRTTDYGKYTSTEALSDSQMYLAVNGYGLDRKSHTYIDYTGDGAFANNEVTITNDGFYAIYIRSKGNTAIPEDFVTRASNFVEIIDTDDAECKFNNNELYRVYIESNADIDIIESSQYLYFRVIDPSKAIVIRKGNTNVYSETFTNILSGLSASNKEEIDGNVYLKLDYYQCLYYDIYRGILNISRADNVGVPNVYLILSGYGQLCGGLIMPIWLKKKMPISPIFNSSPYITVPDWKAKSKTYSDLFNTNHTHIEGFTFFTDPHLAASGNNTNFSANLEKYVGTLQKYYNSTPNNFIVGGGDWLLNNDTPDSSCFKLGYIDGFMNSMFKNYYPVLGNHDTNYQGTEELTQTAINNLWFRKEGKAYYSFDGINTKAYVLDTGKDAGYSDMNSYRWTQVAWLGEKLASDDPEHGIVFMHIVFDGANKTVRPLADNVTKLIAAYNAHSTITLNSVNYDFTECTGKIHYVLAGHIHADYYETVNGVLCIARTTFGYSQNKPSFDLIFNDYDEGKAYLTRVGNGSDITFDI